MHVTQLGEGNLNKESLMKSLGEGMIESSRTFKTLCNRIYFY